MKNHNHLKRTLAGILAVMTVAGYMPAAAGGGGLLNRAAIVASATEGTKTYDIDLNNTDWAAWTAAMQETTINVGDKIQFEGQVGTVIIYLDEEGDGTGYTEVLKDDNPVWTADATYRVSQANSLEGTIAGIYLETVDDVSSVRQLKAAIKNAGATATINLAGDIQLDENNLELEISNGKNITIDGGENQYGIIGVDDYQGGDWHDIFINGSGNVTLTNMKLTKFASQNFQYNTYPIMTSQNYTGNLLLENVTIDKFSRTALNLCGGNVTVNNCTITCGDTAKDKDGKIFQGGIEVYKAAVSVANTTITGANSTYEEWGAGCIQLGNPNGTDNSGSITIASGSFTGQNVLIVEKSVKKPENSASVIVEGGTFNGGFLFEKPESAERAYAVNISGGVFSTTPAVEGATLTSGKSALALTDTTYKFGVATTPTVSVTAGEAVNYNGARKVTLTATPSATVVNANNDAASTADDYTIAYTYQWAKQNATTATQYDNISGATAATYEAGPAVAASGTYQCTIASNNVTASNTASATINKSDFNPTVNITGWTYGSNANDPSVSNSSGGVITYYYKVKNAADSTYLSKVPENAGDYTVKAEIAATDNYNAASATKDFTIAKKSSLSSPPTIKNTTYSGSEIQLINSGSVLSASSGQMDYALGTNATTAPTSGWKTAANITANSTGTYYVWYRITGTNSNYAPVEPTCITITVTNGSGGGGGSSSGGGSGSGGGSSTTATDQTWTLRMDDYYIYDGSAPKPTIRGAVYGDVTYTYYDTETNRKLSGAPSAVGDYMVEVYADGDETHYSRVQYAEYSILEEDPLEIEKEPVNFTGAIGETAKFTVKATGEGQLTYQWQYKNGTEWKNSSMTGAKTATLSVEITEARDGQQYRCIVKDSDGDSLTSNAAKLIVKPAITAQPKDYVGAIGKTAKFTVEATGTDLSYQWQYNSGSGWKDSKMTGADTASLSVEITEARDGQQYRCVVTSENGTSVTSEAATLKLKPAIVTQPKDFTGAIGDTAKFTVEATGKDLTYQWQYYNGSEWKDSGMVGADTASLSVEVLERRDGQQYRCIVTSADKKASVTSDPATLNVKCAIIEQPKDYVGDLGKTAIFTVKAIGKDLTYQWQYNSGDGWKKSSLKGADTASLSVELAARRDGQQYRCIVTAADGTVLKSDAATMTANLAIVTQPENFTGAVGKTAKFTVEAVGKDLTYQWQYNSGDGWKNSGLPGAKTAALSVEMLDRRIGQQYRCIVTAADGSTVTSDAASLNTSLAIIAQPESFTGALGKTATFTVKAVGENLTYQWQYNSGDGWKASGLKGAKTASLSVEMLERRNGQQYRCIVTAADGSTETSDAATMTAAFAITAQPDDFTGAVGKTAVFTVGAVGNGLSYQWQYYNGSEWKNSGMEGAKTASLSVEVIERRDGQLYRCIVKSADGEKDITKDVSLIVEK